MHDKHPLEPVMLSTDTIDERTTWGETGTTPISVTGSPCQRDAGPQGVALFYADPLRWLWEPYWHRI